MMLCIGLFRNDERGDLVFFYLGVKIKGVIYRLIAFSMSLS